MVLTDDDFATIVRAVAAGRQVYDNVQKFILYIFAHAVPEIAPFLLFALSGGAIPLPLTVALVFVPLLQNVFGTAALDPPTLGLLATFPILVWGADEVFRWQDRRRHPLPA